MGVNSGKISLSFAQNQGEVLAISEGLQFLDGLVNVDPIGGLEPADKDFGMPGFSGNLVLKRQIS